MRVYAQTGDFSPTESLVDPYMVGVFPDPELPPSRQLTDWKRWRKYFYAVEFLPGPLRECGSSLTRFRAGEPGTVVVDVHRFGVGKVQRHPAVMTRLFMSALFRPEAHHSTRRIRQAEALEAAGLEGEEMSQENVEIVRSL